MNAPVPGWYPDPHSPTVLRWWDGSQWTMHVRPLPTPAQGGPALPRPAKPFHRRPGVLITAGAVVLLAAVCVTGALLTGRGNEPVTAVPEVVVDEDASDLVTVPDVTGLTLDEASAALLDLGLTVDTIGAAGTVELQTPSGGIRVQPGTSVLLTIVDQTAQDAGSDSDDAYRTAQLYLDYLAFSRVGLVDQLVLGEDYSPQDAESAVARLEAEGGVDWNEQAAEAARTYLEYGSFTREELLDQLTSEYGEAFTPEQAEYGVSAAGL